MSLSLIQVDELRQFKEIAGVLGALYLLLRVS